MKKIITMCVVVIFVLIYEYKYLPRIDHIRWVNVMVELAITGLGAYLFIWDKPQVNKKIISVLDLGFFLFFFSMLIDSLDQFFIHSELYTAILEKSTLLFGIGFIMIGIGKWFSLNQQLNARLVDKTNTDDLTQLLNRRGIMNHLAHLSEQKNDSCLSFIVMDIDDFKVINDKFGHFVGDRTLQKLGSFFKSIEQENWAIGRWGGEEFIIVLSDTTLEQAAEVADKIRVSVKQIKPVREQDPFSITLSFGVSQLQADDGSYLVAVCRADNLLYQAKKAGKDQVMAG